MRACLLIAIAIIAGIQCDEVTIDPFEDSEEVFSVYGSLNTDESNHIIRVRDARSPFWLDTTEIEKLQVTFIDTENNTSQSLSGVFRNFNGNYVLNYPLNYDFENRQRYDLVIENNAGDRSTVSFTTPGIASVSLDTIDYSNPILLRDPVDCFTEIDFEFNNVTEGESIVMFSGFYYEGALIWAQTQTVDVPTREANSDTLTASYNVNNLLIDHFPLANEALASLDPRIWPPSESCNNMDEKIVLIRYFHFGPEWESINPEDITTEALFESGLVENGFGFLGSMNVGEFSFRYN